MKKLIFDVCLSVFSAMVFVGCTEDIDMSARYVFTDPVITDYLGSHEQYSEYCRLLKMIPVSNRSKTTVWQLLSARGHYTVFAPTNEAIQAYLDTLAVTENFLAAPSWDAFTDSTKLIETRTKLVMNSIIDSGDDLQALQTSDFPTTQDAEFSLYNMNERKLLVHHQSEKDGASDLLINNSPVDMRNRDILTTNGVIHSMNGVVTCSDEILGTWIEEILRNKTEGFYVAAMLAKAVGLVDTLNAIQDPEYEKCVAKGLFEQFSNYPEHRKYGYTYFAEPDRLWSETLGKPALDITVDDVVKYLTDIQAYPESVNDDNYSAQNNLLNMFVTYHLLNRKLTKGHIVNHYNERDYNINTGELGCGKSQYYYTMGKRRLMKLFQSRESKDVYINRCPNLDNTRHGNYHEVSCDPDKEGIRVDEENTTQENTLLNAMVYPIDRILIYDQQTRNNLGRERIRFDVASISPELTNNDIRMNELMDDKHMNHNIAPDAYYPYLQDIRMESGTNYMYYGTCRMTGWMDYEGDEVHFAGFGDVVITLPPVPVEDTYELRYRISIQDFFGMHQVFFGSDPDHLYAVGIPIDLRRTNESVGWEPDTEDDDYNAEVEKRLRNNDAMKGVMQHSGMPGASSYERQDFRSTRRILLREKMSPDKTYYLRMKLCLDYQITLFMDYLELCPKSVYDNPNEPEDVW